MNRKGILWLIAILALAVVGIAVFVDREPRTAADLRMSAEGLPVDTVGTLPPVAERGLDDETTLADENELSPAEADEAARAEQFLGAMEAKLSDVRASLEDFRTRASAPSLPKLAQLEMKITSLGERLAMIRRSAYTRWVDEQTAIEQQYEDIVESLNETMRTEEPAGTAAPAVPHSSH